jgi:protein TonB
MIILALALAAQPPSATEPASTPAPAVVPTRAVQRLSDYVLMDDYPGEAVRRRQQGQAFFEMTIGPDGRPVSCRILVSTGAAILDEATCRIMRSRARFIPARDAAGLPTIDIIRHSITWSLRGR